MVFHQKSRFSLLKYFLKKFLMSHLPLAVLLVSLFSIFLLGSSETIDGSSIPLSIESKSAPIEVKQGILLSPTEQNTSFYFSVPYGLPNTYWNEETECPLCYRNCSSGGPQPSCIPCQISDQDIDKENEIQVWGPMLMQAFFFFLLLAGKLCFFNNPFSRPEQLFEESRSITSINYNLIQENPFPQTYCALCLTEFQNEGYDLSKTSCDHIFHTLCLKPWIIHLLNLRSYAECPTCKKILIEPKKNCLRQIISTFIH